MGRAEFLELEPATAAPVAAGEPQPAIRDHLFFLERAGQAMYEGDPESALRYYSRALNQCLQLEEAWVGQCLALLDLGDYDEAALWAEKALGHCPGSGPCFAARALAMARQGFMEKALGFLDTALKVKKDHWLTWLARGEAMVISDKPSAAEHCIAKALEIGGVPRWYILRRAGEMMLLHDLLRQALRYLLKAVELEPRLAMNHLRVAQAYHLLGRKKEAVEYVDRCLVLKRGLAEAVALQNELYQTGILHTLWSRAKGLTGS
jgi:tetratricopeptide (TPR) repeat protein